MNFNELSQSVSSVVSQSRDLVVKDEGSLAGAVKYLSWTRTAKVEVREAVSVQRKHDTWCSVVRSRGPCDCGVRLRFMLLLDSLLLAEVDLQSKMFRYQHS